MSDRLLLEGATCPRCDSPLVSIDPDAGDDAQTRYAFSNIRWVRRWFGGIALITVVFTLLYMRDVLNRGGSILEWMNIGSTTFYMLAVVATWILGAARAWWYLRTRRAGRLATCHACMHRWRL